MKIAVDCRMSGKSGIGVYLDNIVSFMLSNDKNNTYLLIGDKSKLSVYVENPQCRVLHTNIDIFSLRELLMFPVSEINQCDLFYSPNFNIPIGIKIPIYSTIHDVVFLDVNGLTSIFGKFVRRLTLWRTIRISKKIFTVSSFSKSRIEFHFKLNKEIIVANSGISVDIQRFTVTPDTFYPYKYILFVGNIKKHKGIDILIQAYIKACEDGFTQKLVIVGSFSGFKTADDAIVSMIKKQNENVVFTGEVTNGQLYNIISHASILIQPSVYEGFGLPPLEALFLQCNVLVSDIPVFREIYGQLPVSFFNINDIDNFKNKIISCSQLPPLNIDIRKKINELYSLERTARLILNTIETLQ